MEYVIVTGMVIGIVQLVKNLFDRNFRGAVIIAAAAGVGALCGVFGVEGVTVASGIMIGLTGAGAITLAQNVNGPVPTEPVK